MIKKFIQELQVDEEIIDFYVIKSISIKVGANQKKYMDLILGDKTGELTAKKWELTAKDTALVESVKEGDIVKIAAVVKEWNEQKQFRVSQIRSVVETDEVDKLDFIKAAPEKSADMFAYIVNWAKQIKDEEIKELVLYILKENEEKLQYYPAASKNHHAMYGGLLYHTKRMLMSGIVLCDIYKNLNRDYVIAGVILHDMQKINEIDSNDMGIASVYTFEGQMLGHIVQGIKNISKVAEQLNISYEKTIMLEHMILTHHYEPEFGSPKKPLFPEAELLHYLDMVDARMYDMEEVLKKTPEGAFSDRVWTLDNRRMYKPKGEEML